MHAELNTILVTGGCGYLGSQLIRDLATDNRFPQPTIRILDNLQRGQIRALMDLPTAGNFQFVEGDLLDTATVRLALRNVDAVVHLAAVVRTPLSFENPSWLEQVNHWGTAQLVESCLSAGIERMVFASSTAVYGPGGPCVESDPCRPQGPYAQSKLAAEEGVLAAMERGLQPAVLRFGTLFGAAPVMRFDAVANRFAYLAGVARPLTIYGSGEQHRSFLHVRDASAAIRHCLLRPELSGLLNAVSANVSIAELVEIVRVHKPGIDVRFVEQDIRTHYSFAADSQKLRDTDWHPDVTLSAGVGEVVEHFAQLTNPFAPDAH